jgi:outer membrane lipoprotein LolB
MNAVRVALFFAMAALAGCASRPVVPGAGIDWPQRAANLAELQSWEAQGRIGVKSGDKGGQGNIFWIQQGSGSSVSLHGPFGVGAYRIDWNDDDLVITGKAGEMVTSYAGPDAAEQFLTDQLGWSFPARSIRYWMLGITDPGSPGRTQYNADGWLFTLEQDGWIVTYDRFEQAQGRWMPRKIVMENQRARVKLIVDQWRLDSASLD